MKKIIFLFLLFSNSMMAQTIYQKDFSEFWNNINENYAYLEQQKIDWNKVKQIYEPLVGNILVHDKNYIAI